MKTLLVSLLLFLPFSLALAQSDADQSKSARGKRVTETENAPVSPPETKPADPKSAETKAAKTKPETAPRFVDENGDGINDLCPADGKTGKGENAGKKGERARKRDCFIDLDGDGINDSRCNGLGPKMRRRGAAK
ncbi:MAG: hypothetical protein IPP94_10105 [Ignavibacteria bacterium]|nr:hypothetical protein [Ignavibacteria bacterium]